MLERQGKAERKLAGASGKPVKTVAAARVSMPSPKSRRTDLSVPAELYAKGVKALKSLDNFSAVDSFAKEKLESLAATTYYYYYEHSKYYAFFLY